MRRPGIAPLLSVAVGVVLCVGGPIAGESSVRDLDEVFHSPVHGAAWRAVRDDDTGRKWFESADGERSDTIEQIVLREQAELTPIERVVESSLGRAAADPDRAGELVDVTFVLRSQPAHDAGVDARARFAPLLAAPLARSRAILADLASRRADPNVGDPAEDDRLLTAAEKSTLAAARDEVRELVRRMRAEVCARASAEAASDQASLRAGLEARPDVKVFGSSWILSTVSARVPLGTVTQIVTQFPEIGRVGRIGRATTSLAVSVPTIGASTWWNAGATGSGTAVAILDTGVDASHPALTVTNSGAFMSAASSQSDFGDTASSADDYYGHGTHVAGIAASGDSTNTGVAYGASLMDAKCFYLTTSGSATAMTSDIFAAGDWAASNGASVMNCSFGDGSVTPDGSDPTTLFFDAAVFDLAVDVAISAGNAGPSAGSVSSPSDGYNIVCVGNFDDQGTTSRSDDAINSGSSRGPTYDGRRKPDVAAPGTNINSCNAFWENSNPDFVSYTGTSMASPHVAGSIAILRGYATSWTPEGIKALLLTTARNTSPAPTSPGNNWGWGGLDLDRAYTYRASTYESAFTSSSNGYLLLSLTTVPAGARATLVWNRHVRSNSANAPTTVYALTDLDLYLYDASGAAVTSSASAVNPVEQVKASGSMSSAVLKIKRSSSFPSGVTSEPYALAWETTTTPTVVAPAALSCSFTQPVPSFAYANTDYTVTVLATNSGSLPAPAPVVSIGLPSGYTVQGGATRTLSTLAAGGTGTATFVVRATAGPPGQKTVTASASCTSFGESVTSTAITSTHVLDDVAPTGSIVIDAGATYAASTTVTLSLSASDGSGVDAMRLRSDGGAWGAWQAFAASQSSTLAGQGAHSVDVQFRDVLGNVSQYGDGITLDTVAPAGAAAFGDGSPFTTASTATLVLTATDAVSGVAEQRVGTDGTTFGAWETYGASHAIQLGAAEGPTTRYAQFRDAAGNVSATVSATVSRDVTAPTGSIVLDAGAATTNRTTATLTTAATDAVSGVASMRLSFDGVTWLPWNPYATNIGVGLANLDGVNTVYAQFRDGAGNVSVTYSDSILADASPPTGSIAIAGGAHFTGSSSVTLSLSASDALSGVASMRLADDGAPWGAWQGYATSASWTLPGGEGPRTVHAQFQDGSGNVSEDVAATITVDLTPPTGSVTIEDGAAAVNHAAVALQFAASDAASGVVDVRVRNAGGAWPAWTSFAAARPFTLTAGEGARVVEAQFRDAVGNASAVVSAHVLVDLTPPTGTIVLDGGAAFVLPWDTPRVDFASDDGTFGSGVESVELSVDAGATWGASLPPGDPADVARPAGAVDGPGEVLARFRDSAGNVSATTSAAAYFVSAPVQGLDSAKTLNGAIAPGGDVDCYTIELLEGDVLTVKTKSRAAAKGSALGVDLDVYDASHERVVDGRWPANSKKPGVTRFKAASSGTYVVVTRGSGDDAEAGGTYSLSAVVARAKSRSRLKGVAKQSGTVDGVATTSVTFAGAQGEALTGAVKVLVNTPVELVAPDGSVSRQVVRPVRGTAKLASTTLSGGTGDYVLRFFDKTTYALSLAPPRRAARVAEILPPGQR